MYYVQACHTAFRSCDWWHQSNKKQWTFVQKNCPSNECLDSWNHENANDFLEPKSRTFGLLVAMIYSFFLTLMRKPEGNFFV